MFNFPWWIPSINAWMSGIILSVLLVGVAWIERYILPFIQYLVHISPRLAVFIWFLIYLSPIAAIAFVHHYLNLFLDLYFPSTRSPELEKFESYTPSLMSWWEGVYGWMTVVTIKVSSRFLLALILLPYDSSFLVLNIQDLALFNFFTISTVNFIIWFILAAYFYQMEHLVRQYLLSVNSR